ncbi:MAG: S41 family peptidase, partial [Rhodothermales bacterium]
MKRSGTFYVLPALFLLLLGTVLGVKIEAYISQPDTAKQLQKLEEAFLIVNRYYVDEVKADATAEDAIAAMLEGLDPHSSYISPEEIAEVKESFRGSFGGVGIWFDPSTDTVRVISTIPDGPSEAAGVMAGDRIVAIDDTSAIGFTDRQVQKYLKGPVGTKVDVRLRRLGARDPIDVTITRAQIPISTIESAFMVDDETGYIRVSYFAVTTHEEFLEELKELKGQGMKRLVLDLRDNPGGVMQSAVRIADEMLDGKQMIVYTKSRNEQYNGSDYSTGGGTFEKEPVIVLVSEHSASASEIVAGALQDHDRALIVGRRTFGKGLVQQQFPLPDESVLQMTVSRYYTPSGRLIQTPYQDGKLEDYYEEKFASLNKSMFDPNDYIESIPDSLKFKTDAGRTVFGGGGILPDVVVPPDTSASLMAINRQGLAFRFVQDWFNRDEANLRATWADRQDAFVSSYDAGETMWPEFLTWLDTEGFLDGEGEATPDSSSQEDADQEDADTTAASANLSIEGVEEYRDILQTRLKAYLARDLYG